MVRRRHRPILTRSPRRELRWRSGKTASTSRLSCVPTASPSYPKRSKWSIIEVAGADVIVDRAPVTIIDDREPTLRGLVARYYLEGGVIGAPADELLEATGGLAIPVLVDDDHPRVYEDAVHGRGLRWNETDQRWPRRGRPARHHDSDQPRRPDRSDDRSGRRRGRRRGRRLVRRPDLRWAPRRMVAVHPRGRHGLRGLRSKSAVLLGRRGGSSGSVAGRSR